MNRMRSTLTRSVSNLAAIRRLIEWGIAETIEAGLADRLSIQQGSILDLPLSDGYADAMPCTDVLGLIENLPRAVAECARGTQAGRRDDQLCHRRHDRMAAFEQAELDASQRTVAASMDRVALERAFGEHLALAVPAPSGR
jgi:hypothetical protein